MILARASANRVAHSLVCLCLCSTLDCRALVSGFDCDEDGALNFHEFVSMVYSK